eukprot:2099505-Prymnesium_polylepis.1
MCGWRASGCCVGGGTLPGVGTVCCLSRQSRGSSHGPTERHRGRASTACIMAGFLFRSPRYVHAPRDSSL